MKMTPFNWARLAVTGLFLLSAIVSGIQFANAEGSLSTHLMFVSLSFFLGLRTLYSFIKGQ